LPHLQKVTQSGKLPLLLFLRQNKYEAADNNLLYAWLRLV